MILVLLANGFEEIEALTPVDMLRRAGLEVMTVSLTGGNVIGAHGISVKCDAFPDEVDLSEVDMAIFPGGMPGASNIDIHPFTDRVIEAVNKKRGGLAAICAAPMVLGRRGLLSGKRATCYPGFENEIIGAELADESVVIDGNIITAKGMGAAVEFSSAIISLLLGKEKANDICRSICAPIKRHSNKKAADKKKKDENKEAISVPLSIYECPDQVLEFTIPVTGEKKADEPIAAECEPEEQIGDGAPAELKLTGDRIIKTLRAFGVDASIANATVGPRLTRYEISPAKGVKVSKIFNFNDDIALNLAAGVTRMEAPIPGKPTIGLEVPNKVFTPVMLNELMETEEFKSSSSKTFVCIGRDVIGRPIFDDLAKMPHLLIAGATGMGKSVFINSLLVSMLSKSSPDELKLIMIDPKQVEFSAYKDIPHLLMPIIWDAKQAAGALMWASGEMERRYALLNAAGVRSIDAYNEKIRDGSIGEAIPKIVIVIDELADLMLQVKDPVESLIMRIAQKSRAVGIHLVIGTQRPSANVITGVIKANIPSRISFKVISGADSKTILDCGGAERLLDKGDALYAPVGAYNLCRIQSAFICDQEVTDIMDTIKRDNGTADYDAAIIEYMMCEAQKWGKKRGSDAAGEDVGNGYLDDDLFIKAVDIAVSTGKISTSLIQRKLSIGYGKAAKFIDIMEDMGIVSEANGVKPRDVLITHEEWKRKLVKVLNK